MRLHSNLEHDSEALKERLISRLESIDPEERGQWKHHPVTQILSEWLEAEHLGLNEAWAAGAFFSESLEETAQKNAQALGMALMTRILYEWIKETTNYAESEIQHSASRVSYPS